MHKILTIFLVFHIFLTFGCTTKDNDNKTNNLLLLGLLLSQNNCPVGRGAFWTGDFATGGYRCTRVELRAEGEKFRIWEEKDLAKVREQNSIPQIDFQEIRNELQNNALPKLFAALGEPSDVDQDGKVDIAIINLSQFFGSGGAFVAGYFTPLDLFKAGRGLRSNQREIVYIDGVNLGKALAVKKLLGKPNPILAVIAHEMQHLIRWPHSARVDRNQLIPIPKTLQEFDEYFDDGDSLWIDEGTSELSMDIAGYGPQEDRLSCLRNDPGYGCQLGIQGKTLYDFFGSILDYSMSYAWISFLYHNSGSNLSERNAFLKDTVTNSDLNLRGRNIVSLLNRYRNSPKFQANSSGIFQGVDNSQKTLIRLQAGFLANFFKYPNSSTTTAQYGTQALPVDISTGGNNLLNILSFPPSLQAIQNQPSFIPLVNNNPSVFELLPGQMYRVQGLVPSFTESNLKVGIVKNSTNEYAIFNTDTDEKGYAAVAKGGVFPSGTAGIQAFRKKWGLERKPELFLPKIEKQTWVSGYPYFRKRFVWDILEEGFYNP